MDGERDPINLLFLFKFIPTIVKVAGSCVEYFAEEFFDVICCYYPISFKTDENDPRGITAKDLAISLKTAMNCTPFFAPFAVPFYLEKLSTSQVEVKLETLEIFGEASLSFGRKPLIPFSSEIWPSLKTELLRSSNNEILDVCLVTIGKVCRALCESTDSDQYKLNTIAGLLDSAVKELMSPESKMAPLYALMLKSACITSYQSCRLIFNHVIPQLLNISHDYDARDKKSGCLTMFSRLLESIYIYDDLKDSKLINSIYEVVRESLLDEKLRSESINALTRLVLFSKYIDSEKEWDTILKFLLSGDEVRESALLSLEWTSEKDSVSVNEKLIKRLSDHINTNEKEVSKIYDYFGKNSPALHSELIGNLFVTLELLSNENFEKVEALLSSIETISKSSKDLKYQPKFVKIIFGTLDGMRNSKYEIEQKLLDKMCSIVLNLQKSLSTDEQKMVIDEFLDVELFKSFNENSEKISLLQSILISTTGSIELKDINTIAELLMKNSISKSSVHTMKSAQCLSSIINKSSDSKFIQHFCDEITKIVESEDLQVNEKKDAIYTFSWILKAVVMSGNTKIGDSLAKTALKLLGNHNISVDAANIYDIVLMDSPVMNKSTFAKIQVLYKQRFFSLNLSGLLDKLMSDKENEFPVLLAVANMIKHIPHSVLLNDINRIFPIVLKALSSKDKNLVLAGVKTILILIQQSKDKVIENLNTIVDQLLQATRNKESMEIRITSLKCLQEIGSECPYVFIFPYQNEILDVLEDVLDDSKRKVRHEAVICNQIWYGIKDGSSK